MRYYTHNNYSRPFAVDVDGDEVHVFKWLECVRSGTGEYDNIYTDMPILSYNPQRIFIGHSPECPMTQFSGGYGERFDGNSILLHIRDDEYVFIGDKIYKFYSNNIVEFVAPVGNNDVPYPYAITEDGHVYLLIEDVILLDCIITDDFDPYDCYYDNSLITADMGRVPEQLPLIQNHLGITEYYIGEDRYTMRYKTDPSSEYDRVIPEFGERMYVVIDGDVREFTKEEYINLMAEFGMTAGFKHLPTESIIERGD
jgi:hypothetical protein